MVASRHKSIFLLAGVVVLQILLLALQIKRDSEGRLIRVWTVGAFSPFERAGSHGIGESAGYLAALFRVAEYFAG